MRKHVKELNSWFRVCSALTLAAVALCLVLANRPTIGATEFKKKASEFTSDFRLDACTFSSTGSNEYFILEVGHTLILEGEDQEGFIQLEITVLEDTEIVGGIETRVVEEREWEDEELVEVSRNFFAFCVETNSVFYFGEDVDNYEDGEIVDHEGAWRAFEDGNEPGLIMPGIVLSGSAYFQELAPDVAMDQAQIVETDATIDVPLDTYEGCLVTFETTPLEPNAMDFKFYAPGIGLIKDEAAELIGIVTP